jgi:diguanylate cyclase (GGDEF)-like protein
MMRRFAGGRRARVLVQLAAVVLAASALCYAAGVLAGSYVLAVAVLAGVLLPLLGMYARMRRREEQHLRRHARHDSLTALPNRSLFVERVDRVLERAGENSVTVLFVDLDDFKDINHSYGYAAGDELLAAVARRLEESVGPEGTVARLGGDEFTVLLEDASGTSSAVAAARRISRSLEDPFGLREGEVLVSASIGIAVSGGTGRGTPESMLREADVAMQGAKKKGKSRYRIFDAGAESTTGGRLAQEAEMRRAIKESELRVYYQPLVSLATGDIRGVEALVRWQHPLYGLILPGEFVPLAEQTGLIAPVGRWVLREACRQVRAWQREHPADPPLTLSVNISACQFQQPTLAREVKAALKETGLAPRDLKLEITESVAMHDASAVTALRSLKDMGSG